MNKYQITIKDESETVLRGEFYGDNVDEATNMALEHYSHELDTDIDAITILKIIKI
jgi:hypothetical protein